MKIFIGLSFIAVALICCTDKKTQGTPTYSEKIKAAIDNQRYSFIARTAMPASGRSVQLTSLYFLRVTKDTVTAMLPYYGTAYTAPMDPGKGGIDFRSTHFEYQVSQDKKGGWVVSIKPKDNQDVQQMFMNLSSQGYGTLQINNRDRQSIAFSGYVEKEK